MESTQQFTELKQFIEKNGLCVVTYSRDPSYFIPKLHYSFPGLSPYFECNYGSVTHDPIFPDMIKLEIDQSTLDSKLESKTITFFIQSVVGDKFLFVQTSSNPEKNANTVHDVIMSATYDNIKKLDQFLTDKMKSKSQKSLIYTWSPYNGQWIQDKRKMYNKDINDLVGLNDIFDSIKKDITTYRKNKEHLIRLGESNGLNYMLYGPPGTGKSSLIRALAMDLGLAIYVCKMTTASNENQITNMLIPGNGNADDWYDDDVENEDGSFNVDSIKDFKIVLLEDFDRYLESGNNSATMSAILNALDGIFPSFGVIRFFSANNPEVLSKNLALTTRLNKSFYFAKPNCDQMAIQILNAYNGKNINKDKLALFLDFIKNKDMNMRQLTHFLCQYLDSDDPMNDVVLNMEKWIDDMIKFTICKNSDVPTKKNKKNKLDKLDKLDHFDDDAHDFM